MWENTLQYIEIEDLFSIRFEYLIQISLLRLIFHHTWEERVDGDEDDERDEWRTGHIIASFLHDRVRADLSI